MICWWMLGGGRWIESRVRSTAVPAIGRPPAGGDVSREERGADDATRNAPPSPEAS